MSLPSWECGLKSYKDELIIDGETVTPFVGVWIEMGRNLYISRSD